MSGLAAACFVPLVAVLYNEPFMDRRSELLRMSGEVLEWGYAVGCRLRVPPTEWS